MTPGSTGAAQSAGGNTVTPRAAFWRALCVWVLTVAAAGAALIYNHVHPLPPKLGGQGNPAQIASAIELVLEGLHLNRKLNKDRSATRMRYRS